MPRGWKEAFPDGNGTVHGAYADGDTVTVELTWEGTQSGPMRTPDGQELPPSNRRGTVSASFQQSLAVREGEFNNQGPRVDEPITTLPPTLVNRFSPGLWAEARIRPFPGLTLTPGLRFDAYVYGLAVPDRRRSARRMR